MHELLFSEIRVFYLVESILSNGWCVYKCYEADEDISVLAVIIAISVVFLICACNVNDNISDCSIFFTFAVVLLDLCSQLCLDMKILHLKKVDLTWFHCVKMLIQICKTWAIIPKIFEVWDSYNSQKLRPNLDTKILLFFTVFICVSTMILCGRGAMMKFSFE
jgi:hypothetical protein